MPNQMQQAHQQRQVFHQPTEIERRLDRLKTEYYIIPEAQKESIRDIQSIGINAKYLHHNQSLIKQVYSGVPTNIATTYAQGSFEKLKAPAKETYKQRKERERQENIAKSKNKNADHYSYSISHSIQQADSALNNSYKAALTPELDQQFKEKNFDPKLLTCFCQGHVVRTDGKITLNNYTRRMDDIDVYKDFISHEVADEGKTLAEHSLEHMTNLLLNAKLDSNLFSYRNLKDNAGSIKQLCEKFTNFEKIYQHEMNEFYFRNKPELNRLIQTRIINMIEPLNNAYKAAIGFKAIDYKGDYVQNNNVPITADTLNQRIKELNEAIKNREKDTQEIFGLHGELEEGINKNELPAYIQLEDCKQLINSHPNRYKKHARKIDALFKDLIVNVDAITHSTYAINKSNAYIQNNDRTTMLGRAGANAAQNMINEQNFKINKQKQDMDTTLNVINHLLTMSKLTPAGKLLLNSLK